MTVRKIVIGVGTSCLILLFLVVGSVVTRSQGVLPGQSIGWIGGALRGATHFVSIPAYLLSQNFSATTTATIVKNGAGVVGCVVVNTAGAAGSTITLYNSNSASAGYKLATISTAAQWEGCYGMIFSGALTVAIASSGTAPDVTITYR